MVGCTLGPDYQRPTAQVSAGWRWKPAQPSDHVPRGTWWQVFEEPTLNRLQEQAAEANQDLKAALSTVVQAHSAVRLRRADLFPTLDANPEWNRFRSSGNAPTPIGVTVPSFQIDTWRMPFDLSYEVDVWGRIRRSFESARNQALGAVAAHQSVLLTLQADVAAHYFTLQTIKQEEALLGEAIQIRREALSIFEQRAKAGLGNEFEVQRAQVEVATAEAELGAVGRRQAEALHALAVLCGQSPQGFDLEISLPSGRLPLISADLPSTLLERRPDVAEAERHLAARNAEIGVAKTAFFPTLRLTGNGGLQSGDLANLFEWDSRTWTFGPSLEVPVFQAGRGRANLDRARAAYEEAVAVYRQRLLVAFREVDDSLAALHFLGQQAAARQVAANAASKAARLSMNRYTAGAVNFLEVVDSEQARLQSELSRVRVTHEQLLATVRLIKALGGGWAEN